MPRSRAITAIGSDVCRTRRIASARNSDEYLGLVRRPIVDSFAHCAPVKVSTKAGQAHPVPPSPSPRFTVPPFLKSQENDPLKSVSDGRKFDICGG